MNAVLLQLIEPSNPDFEYRPRCLLVFLMAVVMIMAVQLPQGYSTRQYLECVCGIVAGEVVQAPNFRFSIFLWTAVAHKWLLCSPQRNVLSK